MENIDNIMQLCRLCLVKEQVNIPIFGQNNDLEEISAKIRSCLPVKVSPDDSLPKKICDGCSYKLDLLYVFRNTSINSEKQLYQWLEQAGISKTTAATATTMSTPSVTATTIPTTPAVPSTDPIIPTIPATNTTALDNIVNDAITKSEISVKQEKSDSTAGSELSAETQEYLLQQQKLPYQESFGNFNTETNSAEPEEPARKKLRRAAASKPPIKDNESDPDMPPTKAEDDSDEDMDDMGDGGMDDDDDEDEEEEEDGLDHPEFVDVPSTSAEEQPGPSGVNKDPIAAPSLFQEQQLYEATYNDIPNSISLQCNMNMLENSVVEQLNATDADILNLLTTEDDCTAILNNIANNEQFERLININETSFVDELIQGEIKNINDTHTDNCTTIEATLATFKCYECNKSFKTKKLLKKHLFIHSGIRKFSCDICGKSFKYRYEVGVHKKSHNTPTLQCDICSKMFIHKSHLNIHRRKHLGEYVAFCKECNLGFVTQFLYKSHINLVHKNVKLICDICGSCLSSLSSLKEHKLTHNANYGKERNHVCEICGRSYLNLRNLKGHIRSLHERIRPYVCNICGKSVSSKRILETHIKMHTGLKDFECKICDKRFASKEYLELHHRIHSGNKPYCCEYCGKRFTQKTSLTVHLRHHTGQRPYKCECGKEFTTKSHLMTHYKAHDIGGVDIDYISKPVT